MKYLFCLLLLFASGCEVKHIHEVKPLSGDIKIDIKVDRKDKHKWQ